MAVRTIDILNILRPENLATSLANVFMTWEMFRNSWLGEKRELQNYLFAIDTQTTSNSSLPWKNSTHIPKLTQIRDNLHANYLSSLFPNDRPIAWEGDDEDSNSKLKRQVIESYMANKMRLGDFKTEISKCINDFIDYGNCFAMPVFVDEKTIDSITGEEIAGFIGPKMQRISPLDIVFNPTAMTFEESPKFIRTIKTLGGLKADIEDHPEMGYLDQVFDLVIANRQKFAGTSQGDFAKTESYQFAGFSSYHHYFTSDYVELLDFYGDYYDTETKQLYKNYCITLVDRTHIIRKVSNPSWLGSAGIRHAGWRQRPDNLYAMGPLDNLVGMQYRIDHLENAKADAYDLIVHPVIKIKGIVEDFDYGPGERIYLGDEGDVEFARPDTTMLSADTQITMYETKMEEMAGSPKQAMGFRTPGEKTAYEVQVLENGSNRIFINKTAYFEEIFMEPLLNAMLEMARRNMGVSDVIRVMDDQLGAIQFMTITKEDLTARGKIRPIGARHFARNANIVQNLTQLANSAVGRDPAVLAHISGKKMAYLFEELLSLERFHLVQDNIRVAEDLETQEATQSAQQILAEKASVAPPGAAPQGQQGSPGSPTGTPGQIGPTGQPGSPLTAELKPSTSGEPSSNQLAELSIRSGISRLPQGARLTTGNSLGSRGQ